MSKSSGCSFAITSTRVGTKVLSWLGLSMWFYVREPPAVVTSSGLKRPKRLGHGLKCHPTDWWSRGSNAEVVINRLMR